MRLIYVYFIGVIFLSCYKVPNIYNDGTAGKMPRNPKVSDFYYDIENINQYEGRHQEYALKIKSFFWQDDINKQHTVESAFFIVKRFATGGSFDYAFEYRRYIILRNEHPNSNTIKNIWFNDATEIQRGSTLNLGNSNDSKFVFGSPHRTGWYCSDGLYEKYVFEMYFEKDYGPILNQLINTSEQFNFYFPSDNLETNGFQLQETELERIKLKGNLIELKNNSFSLTTEEIKNFKQELSIFIGHERLNPQEYIERANKELLK